MRILTLSNCPLDDRQGSGYVILGYARRLAARGHTVDLLGPPEIEVPRWRRSPWQAQAIRYRQALGMALTVLTRRRHYDLVELYGGEAWLAVTLLRRLRRRPLLVAHSNGLEPQAERLLAASGAQRRWFQRDLSRLYARTFRGCDALVLVSEFDRRFAQAEGYQPAERLLAIDNPLPEAFLADGPPGAAPLAERPPTALFCGSWIPRKGIELLARDGAAFLARHPAWTLLLVGVGDLEPRRHFPAAVADRVQVVPRAERESELLALYRRSRIAIQTSLYESFGLAAAEAMACGCALVASRVGFAAGLADGAEASLLPAPTSPHLEQALARLAADDAFRQRLAASGQKRARQLRWDAAVERLESAYLNWLAAHQQAGHADGRMTTP